jgi:hypothetical protein
MINIKDLMIGDYVCYCDDDEHSFPIRIKGFNEFFDICSSGDWFRGDDISPIPLTGEILKKNGFRELADGDYEISYIDNETSLIWNRGIIYIAKYYTLSKDYIQIKRCGSVHQFQHELKSLGINSDIKL